MKNTGPSNGYTKTTMPKPILLAVDDDTAVLEAVVEDLRRQYGQFYRIMRAASGQAALDTLTALRDRGDAVALLLSDQRMPVMTGVELLQKAVDLYPLAKRVLLTAYADTEVAIRAINSAKIHYYLSKPWDPPEERLYPILDDLLQNWFEGYEPPYGGVQVVGTRWGSQDHAVREYLSRNRVEYRWLTAGSSESDQLLDRLKLADVALPVVAFGDGTAIVQPTQMALAAKIGLRMEATEDFYDLVVIGAGPAGLAAGVYGSSEGLKTLVVEPDAPGGQAGSSSRIENYLGFPQGVSGEELGKRAYLQAQRLGAEFLSARAMGLQIAGDYRVVDFGDGKKVSCRSALIATGVSWVRLQVPGEERFVGSGVYYGAALAEAIACRNEEVYIVGGANSAGQAAVHFAKYASKVHILVRASSLDVSMSRYLINQIEETPNIVVEKMTRIIEMQGEDHLERIRICSPLGEEIREASSVFVFIGAAPKTDWLPHEIVRDDRGFILAGPDLPSEKRTKLREPYLLETSVPGVFVAGDVRHGSIKRAASAVGEGSIAIQFVHQYLAGF